MHRGESVHSGHYYCHIKAASGVWYTLDDDQVSQVSTKSVLNEQAYLLFYQVRACRLLLAYLFSYNSLPIRSTLGEYL